MFKFCNSRRISLASWNLSIWEVLSLASTSWTRCQAENKAQTIPPPTRMNAAINSQSRMPNRVLIITRAHVARARSVRNWLLLLEICKCHARDERTTCSSESLGKLITLPAPHSLAGKNGSTDYHG